VVLTDRQSKSNDSSGLKQRPGYRHSARFLCARIAGVALGGGSEPACPSILSSCWGLRSPPHLLADSSSTGRPSYSSSTFPRGSPRTPLPRGFGSIAKALPLDSMEHTWSSPAAGDETKSEFLSLSVLSSSVHFHLLAAAPVLLLQSCISVSQTF